MNLTVLRSGPATLLALSTCVAIHLMSAHLAVAHETLVHESVTITMASGGYEPSQIYVSPGTEVVFKNVGDADHWPASDHHPSHTLYDGTTLDEHCTASPVTAFDACGPVSPGQSWSFTFDRVGEFKFHDHLWPHLDGVISVTQSGEPEQKTSLIESFVSFSHRLYNWFAAAFFGPTATIELNAGDFSNHNFADFKARLETEVVINDPRSAIALLEAESKQNDEISAFCHDLLHFIGDVAFEKYGNFETAAVYQDDFCNSGYIHGVFESHFSASPDPLVGLGEKCEQYAKQGGREFDRWQCYHGTGHGFMYFTGGDLTESLALCEQQFEFAEASDCQNGVYMELFNAEVLAKETEILKGQSPTDLCDGQLKSRIDCYHYLPTYFSQTQGMSYSAIFTECHQGGGIYSESCVRGIGSEATKRNMTDLENVFAMCRDADSPRDRDLCTEGAIGMYMNQIGSYEEGSKICDVVPLLIHDMCVRVVQARQSLFAESIQ